MDRGAHGIIKESDTAEPLSHQQVIPDTSALLGKTLAQSV